MKHYNHAPDEKGRQQSDMSGTIFRHPQGPLHASSRTKRELAVVAERCLACGHHKRFVNMHMNAKWDAKCTRCKAEASA